jgi:hypothetical protein
MNSEAGQLTSPFFISTHENVGFWGRSGHQKIPPKNNTFAEVDYLRLSLYQ